MRNLCLQIKGIYAITPDKKLNFKQIKKVLQHNLIYILQYRRKTSDFLLKVAEAKILQQLCRDNGVEFIINDDVNLAKEIGADGVHLGENDINVKDARLILGENAIIGASCYNDINLAIIAEQQGADYCAFGSIFISKTKPFSLKCDLNVIHNAKNKIQIPIVAIGGINFENMQQVFAAGCDSVAMIDAIF